MTDTSPPGPDDASGTGRARVLTVITVALFLGAGAFAVAGVRAADDEEPILEVETAVAEVPPSTVPPIVTTTTEPPAETPEGGDEPVPAREFVDLVHPPDDPVPARARPVGLQISSIDVSRYPVRAVGLQDNGQLEIPDETEIGWYKYGATAGHPGSTVLAAHVNWNGSLGPFADLGSVEPGDQIEVALHDGSVRTYEVTERTMYGKLALPKERIWRNTGAEELVLITCGGEFNPELRSYKSNIVVYAVPVA